MRLLAAAVSSRWAPAFYLLIFCALLSVFWVGYTASDDAIYAGGAYGWLTQFPYVGGLGTNRYPLVMPIALSFLLIGENAFALVLPSLLYSLAMAGMLILLMQKVDKSEGGVWAALLLITSPLLVIQSTIASIDVTQAFYQFASFLAFYASLRSARKFLLLFLSGALVGLAFLSKETAIFSAVFYGVLFLAGYGVPRKYYWCIALGFVAVWGVEIVYLTLMTGDPLYRINQSLNFWAPDRPVEDFGNVKIHPLIDPLLLLLVNQEFMFLFWAALPVAVYVFRARGWRDEANIMARLLITLGSVTMACTLLPILPPVPRYFMVPLISFSLAAGLALSHLAGSAGRSKALVPIIGGFLVATNLAGLYVENRDILFGEKDLASIAAASPEPIYTDPMTMYRAELLLKWEGAQEKVKGDAPPHGALYFYNSPRADTANRFVAASEISRYQPKPEWQEIRRSAPDPKWAGVIIEKLGWADRIPAKLWRALYRGHPGTILYRVNGKADDAGR